MYYTNNNFESADLFNWIRQDCAEFISEGNLLLMGDFNAYLPKRFVNYIDNDAIDNHVLLPVNIYNPDPAMPRNTLEVRNINQNDRLLLEMCSNRAKLEYPVHGVQNIETDAISSILNRTISVDEMRRAINS